MFFLCQKEMGPLNQVRKTNFVKRFRSLNNHFFSSYFFFFFPFFHYTFSPPAQLWMNEWMTGPYVQSRRVVPQHCCWQKARHQKDFDHLVNALCRHQCQTRVCMFGQSGFSRTTLSPKVKRVVAKWLVVMIMVGHISVLN